MTGMDLLRLLGEVDDKHIELSLEEVRKSERRAIVKWISVAACIALVIGVGAGVYFSRPSPPPVVSAPLTASTAPAPADTVKLRYPDENEKCLFKDDHSWHQTRYYDYAELANEADMVVVVDVVSTDRFKGNLYNIPYANVAVCEVIKGDTCLSGETLRVRDNGTSLYNKDLDSWVSKTKCGGPLMEQGNKLLLFLRTDGRIATSDGEPLYEFANNMISKFFYDRDGKYHSSATYCEQFGTNYMMSDMLEDYSPKTLDEIKRLIQAD